jgi:hypothetical protein
MMRFRLSDGLVCVVPNDDDAYFFEMAFSKIEMESLVVPGKYYDTWYRRRNEAIKKLEFELHLLGEKEWFDKEGNLHRQAIYARPGKYHYLSERQVAHGTEKS